MSLATHTTAKPPSASSPRLRAIAAQNTHPAERLANQLVAIFSEIVEQKTAAIAQATIEQLERQGWRAPTPSRAYIEETYVRCALGRRSGSTMASKTFVTQYISTGLIQRAPASLTGNHKTKYVFWKDVERILSEKKADDIRRHIIEP